MSETDLWASIVFALMGGLLVGAIFSSGLEAQEQPTESIRLRIEMQGTAEEFEGLLLSATTENFIIRSDERLEGRNPGGGGTISLPTDSIRLVQLLVGSHGRTGRGALLGALGGLGIGAAYGGFVDSRAFPLGCNEATTGECPGLAALTWGVAFAALGTGLGAMIGLGVRTEEWRDVTPESLYTAETASRFDIGIGPSLNGGLTMSVQILP